MNQSIALRANVPSRPKLSPRSAEPMRTGMGEVTSGDHQPGLVSSASKPSSRFISRDEMNLAEFPLTVLSTRSNPSLKTLEFTDTLKGKNGETTTRHWIITGADKFGLPTASDDEVLLGLLKLTVDDGMRARRVYFTRYELLRVLRWTTEGRNYTRLQRALDRLTGVRIKATNAFYDNSDKAYSTRNFGIIDSYEINCGRDGEISSSFFEWSEVLFASFKSGFIKKLDLDVYLGLESAVAKRLYRYLDKHFWFKSKLELNLFTVAHEKVGISRNYRYPSSLRQQLDPALEELQNRGLIAGFSYKGKGKDTTLVVCAAAQTPRSAIGSSREAERSRSMATEAKGDFETSQRPMGGTTPVQAVAAALVERGLSESQALRLLGQCTESDLLRVSQIVAHFDTLIAAKSSRVSRSPIGFLYRAVENFKTYKLPSDSAQERFAFSQRDTKLPRSPTTHSLHASDSAQSSGGNREAEYLVYRRRRIAELRTELPARELSKLRESVEAALSKLKGVIRPENFAEAVEHAIAEKIAIQGGVPSFVQWLNLGR